jgi:hypothetical protein
MVIYAKLKISSSTISKIKINKNNAKITLTTNIFSANQTSNISILPSIDNLSTNIISSTPESISIDWSCKATPIINQGQCGSCYIIAPL